MGKYPTTSTQAMDFCEGYTLPDDVTLGDVLGALEEFQKDFCGDSCRKLGPDGGHWEECDEARALLAKFRKEPD